MISCVRACGVGDVAGHLRLRDALGGERERARRVVAGLGLERSKSMVRASRRGQVPVLRRPTRKPSSASCSLMPVAAKSPARPAGAAAQADVDEAVEEGAGGEDDAARQDGLAELGFDAGDAVRRRRATATTLAW